MLLRQFYRSSGILHNIASFQHTAASLTRSFAKRRAATVGFGEDSIFRRGGVDPDPKEPLSNPNYNTSLSPLPSAKPFTLPSNNNKNTQNLPFGKPRPLCIVTLAPLQQRFHAARRSFSRAFRDRRQAFVRLNPCKHPFPIQDLRKGDAVAVALQQGLLEKDGSAEPFSQSRMSEQDLAVRAASLRVVRQPRGYQALADLWRC